jgi:hypothetical protein
MPKILGTEEEKGLSLCASKRKIAEKEGERMVEQCPSQQPVRRVVRHGQKPGPKTVVVKQYRCSKPCR